jgi:cytochrome c-type biogenesis protein CcmH
MKRLWMVLVLSLACSFAAANEAKPLAEDPAVEQRLIRISEDIRCLVCQNESLAGSRADLANDLRREIRKLIREGKTDAEITDFLVSRYGDFVLYRPPVKPLTWVLWFGPFLLLLGGVVFLIRFLRQRQQAHAAVAETPLSDEERRRAKALLDATEN